MTILLTNDDAYYAPGIKELYAELSQQWEVVMVAPDREQSAASHAITLNQPLRINALGKNMYAVDGTPVDCVLLAIYRLLKKRPALVISGINHGPNLGEDVIYSGTVSAAREGAMLGIPSLAVSVTEWTKCRFGVARKVVTRLARTLLSGTWAKDTFLNVNVPNLPRHRIRGTVVTRLGRRTYKNIVERRADPRGKPYYWISGTPVWKKGSTTDYQAIQDRRISVTPLTLDLNDGARSDEVRHLIEKITLL